jgi:hypothetical protein
LQMRDLLLHHGNARQMRNTADGVLLDRHILSEARAGSAFRPL